MKIKTKFLASAIIAATAFSTEMFPQGLGFHGMDYRIDQRTSWNVFGDSPQAFAGEFMMEFELYTSPSSEFGYFFRIKDGGDSKRIWNLSYDSRGDSIVVRLNEEGRHSLIKASLAHEHLPHLHWHHVSVDFDLLRDSVFLDIAGKRHAVYAEDLPDRLNASIEFGRSDHIIDVPAFAVRNMKIGNHSKHFVFSLGQRSGNVVRDSAGKVKGYVQNPEWLVNEAMNWKETGSFSYNDIAGATYNPVRKEFYYFTREEMTTLDLMTGRHYSHRFSRPCPVTMKLGNNFVSEDGRFLYVYELYNDEVPPGSPSVARFDLDSRKWETICTEQADMPMHHHGCFRNPLSHRYTILGGFGNMLYNGRFLEFDEASGHWNEIWKNAVGDRIFPRYFTSAGTDGKYIYVYGGMGNECGEQVVGRRYFYDLHRVNPATGESLCLWSIDRDDSDKVPVRNLYVDGDCFYTLCYPEYIGKSELRLYRFSIADGSHEALCNSIPIVSDKMRTNANLYIDRELGHFYTTVQEFEDDIKSTLKIYSLVYPPVSEVEAEALDDGRNGFPGGWNGLWATITIAIAVLGTAAGTVLMLKKKKSARMELESSGSGSRRRFRSETIHDSISLFGDFTVIDHEGKDITPMFTNQQILILCLLIKRGNNGISTRRLSSILWPDKEEDKVKNSRGVAINNLRKSLGHLHGAAVSYRDGRYYLELTDECRCDWFELNDVLRNKNMNKTLILNIISRGKFLKSIGDPLFDDFKEQVDNMILPLLHEEADLRLKSKDYEAVREIGEMAVTIDPTDEKALHVVIQALRRQKLTEEALVFYASFCAEYKKANGTDFGTPFKEI